MDDQPNLAASPFDAIRRVDEQSHEYWNAKDLAKLLGYSQFSNFTKVIRKAEKAREDNEEALSDHFLHVQESINTGKGATKRSGVIKPEYLVKQADILRNRQM